MYNARWKSRPAGLLAVAAIAALPFAASPAHATPPHAAPPHATPPRATAPVTSPPPNSALRKQILAVIRPSQEKLFGKPIEFKVEMLNVQGNYAFASLHPQRPGGKAIVSKIFQSACENDAETFDIEVLLKKVGSTWRYDIPSDGQPSVCADDSIADDSVLKARGLSPQLFGRTDWLG